MTSDTVRLLWIFGEGGKEYHSKNLAHAAPGSPFGEEREKVCQIPSVNRPAYASAFIQHISDLPLSSVDLLTFLLPKTTPLVRMRRCVPSAHREPPPPLGATPVPCWFIAIAFARPPQKFRIR